MKRMKRVRWMKWMKCMKMNGTGETENMNEMDENGWNGWNGWKERQWWEYGSTEPNVSNDMKTAGMGDMNGTECIKMPALNGHIIVIKTKLWRRVTNRLKASKLFIDTQIGLSSSREAAAYKPPKTRVISHPTLKRTHLLLVVAVVVVVVVVVCSCCRCNCSCL